MFMKHYYSMKRSDIFWNRKGELERVRLALRRNGFGFVTGRRRIGKTALLTKACKKFGGFYHQAVEGTPEQLDAAVRLLSAT